MTSRGQVRVWHHEEGGGVIDSSVTPGGCWAGFSSVQPEVGPSAAYRFSSTLTFDGDGDGDGDELERRT